MTTPPLFAEVTSLLRDVTGEDAGWAARIRPDSRLDGDLLLDSIEIAALHTRLRERFGPATDLAGFLAGLDLDGLIGLTVGDLAARLATDREAQSAAEGAVRAGWRSAATEEARTSGDRSAATREAP